MSKRTGEVREYFCESWRCEVHQARPAAKWRARIARAEPERFITLTGVPDDRASASLAWSHLVQAIRRKGLQFEYVKFLEAGEAHGALHWHLAQIGSFVPKRWLETHCPSFGLGYIVDIQRITSQNSVRRYLSKYLTKDSAPRGWRKVTTSKHFPGAAIREKIVSTGEWFLDRGTMPIYERSF